jgi:hypothetical protein
MMNHWGMPVTKPKRNQDGGFFGSCPHCKNADGYLNIGRGHWMFCDEHRTRWFIGTNLFSSWRDETEAEQRQYYEEKDFGNYADVESVYPPEGIRREHSFDEDEAREIGMSACFNAILRIKASSISTIVISWW